jgi:hypothetical protein
LGAHYSHPIASINAACRSRFQAPRPPFIGLILLGVASETHPWKYALHESEHADFDHAKKGAILTVAQPTVWEYLVDRDLTAIQLNTLGAEGWEFVGINQGVFYLKRPRPGFKERVTLDQRSHFFPATSNEHGAAS